MLGRGQEQKRHHHQIKDSDVAGWEDKVAETFSMRVCLIAKAMPVSALARACPMSASRQMRTRRERRSTAANHSFSTVPSATCNSWAILTKAGALGTAVAFHLVMMRGTRF